LAGGGKQRTLTRPVAAGYASDLLSCAMSRAKKDYIWVTLQAHVNVVAVASLLGLSGVIITEGNLPDPDTIARAESEGVVLLLTPKPTFAVVSELAALGVRTSQSRDSSCAGALCCDPFSQTAHSHSSFGMRGGGDDPASDRRTGTPHRAGPDRNYGSQRLR